MWIQIFGLSLEMHNRENAYSIGNTIGQCLSVEDEETARQRTFLRLKVELDVTIPLTYGFWWTSNSDEEKRVTVKYERLSDVCYRCGLLGHTSIHCGAMVPRSETQPELMDTTREESLSVTQEVPHTRGTPQS